MESRYFIDMLYKKYGKKKLHKNAASDMMLIEFTDSEGKKWRGYAVCIGDVKDDKEK